MFSPRMSTLSIAPCSHSRDMAVLKPNHAAQRARRQLVLTATIVLAGVAALWVLLRQPTQLVVNGAQQVRRWGTHALILRWW